jgi:hypothetical protein
MGALLASDDCTTTAAIRGTAKKDAIFNERAIVTPFSR